MKTNVRQTVFFQALCLITLLPSLAFSQGVPSVQRNPEVGRDIRHDVSPPLRYMQVSPRVSRSFRVNQRLSAQPFKAVTPQPDPVLQDRPLLSSLPVTVLENADGLCNTSPLLCSQQPASQLIAIPPDTNGAAGQTKYVQWVNYAIAVFNKSDGSQIAAPFAGNSLWQRFGGQCEANNSGDAIVQYDKAAGKWVFMQPAFTPPYTLCFAISISEDPLGSYNRYAFTPTTYFPDYPKLGIWPDGYYVAMDLYTGQGYGGKFKGTMVCAFDRSSMLAGSQAGHQCFQLSADFPHLLPSIADSRPPSGSPNFFVNLGSDSSSLNLWKFHVDFAGSSTALTGPIYVPVATFSQACGGGICIPQLGTNRLLDSLGDRLMYRLAYRKVGTTESLVASHSVSVQQTAAVGIRWYEIRNPNGVPVIYQQSTFAPDGNFRWMGSIAMDKVGDIAVGYSLSSNSVYPSIAIAGRVPSDPVGKLEAEKITTMGGGSQTNASNWGDYSGMSVDPVDDCTFWYTTEYYKLSSNYNWSTKIASFKFPTCQ